MRARLRSSLGVLLALAACGCDPTVFDALRDDAPVLVITPPTGAGVVGAFGSVLAAYDVTIDGARSSRLVVAGGAASDTGSSYRAFPVFDGLEGDAPRLRLGDAPIHVGCESDECSDGHGVSIATFPEWRTADGMVSHGCVAVPSQTTGDVQVRCEDMQPTFRTITGPPGEEFGRSAAGIESAQHPVGAALFGAPAAADGEGALYRLPIGGESPQRIDLSAAMVPANSQLGTSVAVAPISDTAVIFATRAIGMAADRVIVGTLEVDAAVGTVVVIRGCMEGPSGFGGALALGDLDGDGAPDLAVGTSSDATEQSLRVYDGAALSIATAVCGRGTQPEPVATLTCGDVADDPDLTCPADGRIGLGAALAIGDVDGDGIGDLIAGAPEASPLGEASAGAVFALAGESGSLARIGATHATMFHSAQEPGDQLGRSIVLIPGVGRDEIAAGSLGAREVAVFLCSGLPDDRPTEGRQRGCIGL